jgi:hypothetical protein
MIRKQLIMLAGAAPAAVVVVLVCRHAAQLFSSVILPADDAASRLVYVAHWLMLPGVTLLAGLGGAGIERIPLR